MDKQNTLIITYEMVPFTTDWGGCQRVFYYSKFLSDNNHNIIVIASKNSNKVNYYGQTTSFRVIHLKNLGHSIGISGNYSAVSKTKRHLKNILKIIVRYFEKQAINNPSIGVGINSFLWVVMNNNRIIDIIKKNNVYNVIISAPPFGLFSLYLIRKLLKNIGGGVTIDYRDPWNCWWGDKSIAYYREKAICRLAKNIIVTNTNHKRKLMIDFGIPQKKISVVMNGYDVNTWSKVIERNIKRRNDKFIIRYIGNIDLRNQNKFRDLTIFYSVLNHISKDHLVSFEIIGANNTKDVFMEFEHKYKFLRVLPKVHHEQALNLMLSSDLLLNVHTEKNESAKYLIAGKIFDYLKSGKPVLSINSELSAERDFLLKIGFGHCVKNDFDEIKIALLEMYDLWLEGKTIISPDSINLNRYSRDHQNAVLSAALDPKY